MKLYELQQKLSKLKCFTPIDIKRFSGLSETAVNKIIWRYTQKGIFVRLRNGLYIFENLSLPPLWHIANKVYQPSYISFETALSYYGIIPESV
ncbi:MAG: type IV toxin-antitoxin system AbiEi family antitoxin domain-containing protein [Elusimicrobiota bacterium]